VTDGAGRVLLLSGGIDSAALAALLRPARALFIDYGQTPAPGEFRAARAVADHLGLRLDALRVDCRAVGAGLLAGAEPAADAPSPEWWPFRNQLLGTLAAGWALRQGMTGVVFGTVASDGLRHHDGTSDFISALDALTASQEGSIRVEAPATGMTSAELVRASGVDQTLLGWTFSCHVAATPCTQCPGCAKQRDVLAELSPKAAWGGAFRSAG
jgi:7-cyano-7-deazaguanine synthase